MPLMTLQITYHFQHLISIITDVIHQLQFLFSFRKKSPLRAEDPATSEHAQRLFIPQLQRKGSGAGGGHGVHGQLTETLDSTPRTSLVLRRV